MAVAASVSRAKVAEACSWRVRQRDRVPSGVADGFATAGAAYGPGYWVPRCDGFSIFAAGEAGEVAHAAMRVSGRATLWIRVHRGLVRIDTDIDRVRIDPVARLVAIERFPEARR